MAIFFIGVFAPLFFTSCEKEETVETTPQSETVDTTDDFHMESISFEELQDQLYSFKDFQRLTKHFGKSSNTAKVLSTKSGAEYLVNTEEIKKVELGDYTSYTMPVEGGDGLQNIVLEPTGDHIITKLQTYTMSEEPTLNQEGLVFGNINEQIIDNAQVASKYHATKSGNCSYVQLGFPYPCNGIINGESANHYPGDSCSASQLPGYLWVTTQVCYAGGNGAMGPLIMPTDCDDSICDAPVGGGSGADSGLGGGNDDPGVNPIVDANGDSIWDVYLRGAFELLKPLNLSSADKTWLTANGRLIDDFLAVYKKTNSPELTKKIIEIYREGEISLATNAINVLIANPNANPLLEADCRSFEYAQPPGATKLGCAVVDFDHTFYTAGIRSNGSPYYGEIDIETPKAFFTMPTWMRPGVAANNTAKAITIAIKATDIYFFENPDITEGELATFFNNAIRTQLAVFGGTYSTSIEPHPIPSPAPYLKSVLGIGHPYDCD